MLVVKGWIKTATVDWKRLRGRHIVRVPIAYLRDMLRREDELDGNTRARFERWSRGENRDVRFEVDTMIASEMSPQKWVEDYHNLNFSEPEKEAAKAAKAGAPQAAVWICQGITESIGIHYDAIDDSGGYVWPFFGECMENMGAYIMSMDLSDEDRRQYISYLATWSLRAFSDFMEYYHNVLLQLCRNREELEIWKDILESERYRTEINEFGNGLAINKYYFDPAYSLVSERIKEISQ